MFVSLASMTLVAQGEKVVPVHEEPRHRLVFDSPLTKILDIQIPPGDTTLFHTHSDPILYVSISNSQMRNQTLGGEWPVPGAAKPQAAEPRVGRMMSTTSYAVKPLTHRVNNIGQTLFRLIGITNASAGDESNDASIGFAAQPEISNPWFRGYRVALGKTTQEHRHANPVAIVLVSGRALVSGPTSKEMRLNTIGAFAWVEANESHSLRGADEASEVVEVEVRRPRG